MERQDTQNQFRDSTLTGMLVQAGQLNYYQQAPGSADGVQQDRWVEAVRDSAVWRKVPAEHAVEPYLREAALVAGRLAFLREQAQRTLAADPWQDPDYGRRFLHQAEAYLPPDLYPAEAALLVLVPLIHHVYQAETAVRHLGVDPVDLSLDTAAASGDRLAYQRSIADQDMLLGRAALRPEAREPIGWWLFHRWLLIDRGGPGDPGLPDLVERIVPRGSLLGEALQATRLRKLVYGLRRGPEVCSPEYLDELKPDDALGGPGRQRVRERRLGLLLALAHGMAIELTALPDIIVDHIGIPEAVEPGQLRETLAGAAWKGPDGLPVLDAVYHHGAVKEALGEHIARLDEMLHGIHHVIPDRVAQSMPELPKRLSMEGVTPSDPKIVNWAKFRLDERRVRDMLMGTQLYKDRNLAVRELYQNALDACRYREARTKYLRATGSSVGEYEGEIRFVQGEEDGRPYLECQDNGVGMGESQLRGVFSQAGARFADLPAYKLEEAEWATVTPPIELFPNSRFGIGVLSYFMLADEIRVTTCRMDRRTGLPGPVLEASIFGPGHLFKIREVAERGAGPYTHVRLYLRDDPDRDQAWSCVDVLCEVLGIAEFTTRAEHGSRVEAWERDAFVYERTTDSVGLALRWSGAPEGVDIFWCEGRGTLLVDGLVAMPPSKPGPLSTGENQPYGLVINLSGRCAAVRLSVDRTQVLEHLPSDLSSVIEDAARALVADQAPFVTYTWLNRMSGESPRLADVVADALVAVGSPLRHNGGTVDLCSVGTFAPDLELAADFLTVSQGSRGSDWWGMPDHIFLWRVLAHGGSDLRDELTSLVPELADMSGPLRAIPSDRYLLSEGMVLWTWRTRDGRSISSNVVFEHVDRTGWSPRDVAARAHALGVLDLDPAGFEWAGNASTRQEAALLAAAPGRGLSSAGKIEAADLVPIHHSLGIGLADAARRLRRYGFDAPTGPLPEHLLSGETLRMLSRNQTIRRNGWLPRSEAVPPGHVIQTALALGVDPREVVGRLEALGRHVESFAVPSQLDQDLVKLLSSGLDGCWPWLSSNSTVPPGHLLAAESELGLADGVAARTLSVLGFRVPPLPERRNRQDRDILARHETTHVSPDEQMEFRRLFAIAERTGEPLAVVVDRLEAYGIPVGLRFPGQPRGLDQRLLSTPNMSTIDNWWFGLKVGETVPFYRAVVAAGEIGCQPHEVAERLASYGVPVSRLDLPAGLDPRQAHVLGLENTYSFYPEANQQGQPNSLPYQIRAARRVHLSLAETNYWLRELGLGIPDAAEIIRAALALVPREPM
ncbi:hypothetical protein [Kitasatospora sp. NPDC097643]|uniref:wHTH domain-containing protein n=1 Tax=Kitasatospora sp. NPDC097643 TaxID=3157230 RepID=UPI00331CFD9F